MQGPKPSGFVQMACEGGGKAVGVATGLRDQRTMTPRLPGPLHGVCANAGLCISFDTALYRQVNRSPLVAGMMLHRGFETLRPSLPTLLPR